MTPKGPLALVKQMAAIFEELELPYALGGSMASSLLGEPRTTVDVDMAVQLDDVVGDALIERFTADFYVPVDSAREAIRAHSSFNLIDTASALKVDLFVVGDGLLDRMQIERRVHVPLPTTPGGIWVTSAEDQVLRKLDWFRRSGAVSDRQWRDVVGILRVNGRSMDFAYLSATAEEVGLGSDLDAALDQAGLDALVHRDKPVLVIDGSQFEDLDGFAREFSKFLNDWEWHGNLDAFNDILRGGFGTPEGGFVLRWTNSDRSSEALGSVVFQALVEVINAHGPGGDEAEDGIDLELL